MRVPYLFFLLILLLCIILSIVLISLNAFNYNYKKGGYVLNKKGGTRTKAEITSSISEINRELEANYNNSVNSTNIGEIINTLDNIILDINQRKILEKEINTLLKTIQNSPNFNSVLINNYVKAFNQKYPIDSEWNVINIHSDLISKQRQSGNSRAPTDLLITKIIEKIKDRNQIIINIEKYKSKLPINISEYEETQIKLNRTKNTLDSLNSELLSSSEDNKPRRNAKNEKLVIVGEQLEREKQALEQQELEREKQALEQQELERKKQERDQEQALIEKIDQEFNIGSHIQYVDSLVDSVSNNMISDIESCRKELDKLKQTYYSQEAEIASLNEEIALFEGIDKDLREENTFLASNIRKLEHNIIELESNITELKNELSGSKSKIRELESKIRENEFIGPTMENRAFEEEQLATLYENNASANRKLNKTENELVKCKKLLKEKEVELANLLERHRRTIDELVKLTRENEILNEDMLNIQDATYNNLKSDFTKSFEEILVPIRNDNDRLQKSNSRLGQNNSKLQKNNSRLEQSNSILEQSNSRLEQSNNELKQSNVELQERSIAVFDENTTLLKTKNELIDKNNTLEAKMSKKNIYQKQAIETINGLTTELKRIKGLS